MSECNTITGVPKACNDNNLGSIKRVLIGSFADVTDLTVTATGDPDTDGKVTAVTRTATTKFEEFVFPKDTSSFEQNLVVDFAADTHGFEQSLVIGLRKFELRKRNAIMLLVEGRRELIAVVEDNNNSWWMLGADQGMRLSENSATTNDTRQGGQQVPITLTSEYERHMMYEVDAAVAVGLLTAAE